MRLITALLSVFLLAGCQQTASDSNRSTSNEPVTAIGARGLQSGPGASTRVRRRERVGLVIGIGDYETLPDLRNPANDARVISAKLEELGFQMVGDGPQINPSRSEVIDLLTDFELQSRGALAAIYLAGHGSQHGGKNYLIPQDNEKIRYREDLPLRAVPIDQILNHLNRTGMAIVMVDACRDNPLTSREKDTRNLAQGLAQLRKAPTESIVVFATQSGEVALDAAKGGSVLSEDNSPFAMALNELLATPDVEIGLLMRRVRERVEALTGGEQYPEIVVNLGAQEVYLSRSDGGSSGGRVVAAAPISSPLSPPAVSGPSVSVLPSSGRVSPPPGSDVGVLILESTPIGAEVLLDEVVVGRTPLTGHEAVAGQTMRLRLRKNDYRDRVRSITVQSGMNDLGTLSLTPAFGRLEVTSEPSGATVYLGGQARGQTPLTLDRLASDRYQLSGRMDLHRPAKPQAVDIRDGETTRVSLRLEPDYGTVTVRPTPSDASVVFEKGDRRITATGGRAQRLAPGRYVLSLERTGYAGKQLSVTVVRGRSVTIEGSKAGLRRQIAHLIVSTRPLLRGASVYVDGTRVGTVPGQFDVGAGSHVVRVSGQGRDGETRVDVGEGERKTVTISVAAASPAFGSVTSSSGREWSDPVTGMKFVWVPGGTFEMGCLAKGALFGLFDGCDRDETPVHTVTLDGFWLGKYEVTQSEWRRVMGGNPSRFKKGDRYPVENVLWDEAQSFIRELNSKGSAKFGLPSEAQWEYACRSGGKNEKYAGGSDLESVSWYWANAGRTTHTVGGKRANGLGLYDMSGNVCEWVQDKYYVYTSEAQTNPIYEGRGAGRVLRGGSWRYNGGARVAPSGTTACRGATSSAEAFAC